MAFLGVARISSPTYCGYKGLAARLPHGSFKIRSAPRHFDSFSLICNCLPDQLKCARVACVNGFLLLIRDAQSKPSPFAPHTPSGKLEHFYHTLGNILFLFCAGSLWTRPGVVGEMSLRNGFCAARSNFKLNKCQRKRVCRLRKCIT